MPESASKNAPKYNQMPLEIRPEVLRLTPYSPGKPIDEVRRELGLEHIVKLASNENPLGPSPKALEAIRREAAELHYYPDAAAWELSEGLAQRFEVAHNQVLVGNGSDELLALIAQVLLTGPEDEILMAWPSFIRYDAGATLAGAKIIKVPLTADHRHDLPTMASKATDRTKIVWIANPNNPTGTYVTKTEVDAFLHDLPEQALVVFDEAYYEFARENADYPNSLDYLHAGKQVVGLRTFSKAYGLAGLRLGYGFAPAELVDAIQRAREPFNVHRMAQSAGLAALDDAEHLARTLESNRRGVAKTTATLEALGATVARSAANFVFADFGRPARPIYDSLLKQGYIVRPGDVLGAPNALRISIGTEEEMQGFVEALELALRPEVVS